MRCFFLLVRPAIDSLLIAASNLFWSTLSRLLNISSDGRAPNQKKKKKKNSYRHILYYPQLSHMQSAFTSYFMQGTCSHHSIRIMLWLLATETCNKNILFQLPCVMKNRIFKLVQPTLGAKQKAVFVCLCRSMCLPSFLVPIVVSLLRSQKSSTLDCWNCRRNITSGV